MSCSDGMISQRGKRMGMTKISNLSFLRHYRGVTAKVKWNSEFAYSNPFLKMRKLPQERKPLAMTAVGGLVVKKGAGTQDPRLFIWMSFPCHSRQGTGKLSGLGTRARAKSLSGLICEEHFISHYNPSIWGLLSVLAAHTPPRLLVSLQN